MTSRNFNGSCSAISLQLKISGWPRASCNQSGLQGVGLRRLITSADKSDSHTFETLCRISLNAKKGRLFSHEHRYSLGCVRKLHHDTAPCADDSFPYSLVFFVLVQTCGIIRWMAKKQTCCPLKGALA